MAKTYQEILDEVKMQMTEISDIEAKNIASSLYSDQQTESIDDYFSKKSSELKKLFKSQKTKQQAVWKIAKMLIDKFHIKTITEAKPEIYLYQKGVYKEGEAVLKFQIQHILEESYRNNDINEILGKVKNATPFARTDFDSNKFLINLKNGVLNIITRKFRGHSPDNLFLNILPVEYNESVDCPAIKKFLSEILKENDIPIIQEWFGYCLFRQYFIKKAMIFVGERDTGKTTTIRLLSALLGKNNISGSSLQKISTDKFAVAQMYGKYANIYDDLSFRDIQDNGMFKIATGAGLITGEYKFGNQFNFENYAKLTFACNKIPKIKDMYDDAYFSRWIVIRFDNEIKEQDPLLIEKLTVKEEMSGLLNWVLEGLKRLLATYTFSYEKSSTDVKQEMLSSGSSIAGFAYEMLAENLDKYIYKDAMYEQYIGYCHKNGLAVETKEMLGRKLQASAPYILEKMREEKKVWFNVGFKNEMENIPDADPDDYPQLKTFYND